MDLIRWVFGHCFTVVLPIESVALLAVFWFMPSRRVVYRRWLHLVAMALLGCIIAAMWSFAWYGTSDVPPQTPAPPRPHYEFELRIDGGR